MGNPGLGRNPRRFWSEVGWDFLFTEAAKKEFQKRIFAANFNT